MEKYKPHPIEQIGQSAEKESGEKSGWVRVEGVTGEEGVSLRDGTEVFLKRERIGDRDNLSILVTNGRRRATAEFSLRLADATLPEDVDLSSAQIELLGQQGYELDPDDGSIIRSFEIFLKGYKAYAELPIKEAKKFFVFKETTLEEIHKELQEGAELKETMRRLTLTEEERDAFGIHDGDEE